MGEWVVFELLALLLENVREYEPIHLCQRFFCVIRVKIACRESVEQQYFVWDTATQSTNRKYTLEVWRGRGQPWPPWPHQCGELWPRYRIFDVT